MRLNNVLRKTQHILVVLTTLTVAACSSTRPHLEWTDEALEAENRQAEGDYEAAQAQYRRLIKEAPSDEDRRWMTYDLGTLQLQRGHTEKAIALFERVYEEDVRDRFGANAMHEVARIRDDDELRLDLIRRYPEEVAAEFALDEIVRKWRNGRAQNLEKTLKKLHDDVAETEVDDNILFSLAEVRREELDDPDGALEAYRVLYRQDPDGPLADDALWEMAEIYRSHQMWEPAVQILEVLASDNERSWFVGIYRSDWVDDAVYDLGWIHLLWLDDADTARRWFKRYLRRYPGAVYADDAAWQLVEAERLSGDGDSYQAALNEFPGRWPESRHVRVANRRLGGDG